METLSARQANSLIRARDLFRGTTPRNDAELVIEQLLDIINTLEVPALQYKPRELHGWSVTLRGQYKQAESKLVTALQFVVMSKVHDDVAVLEVVKERYGGRNNLLDGFTILDYELHAIDEKTMCVGTGVAA